MIRADAVPVTDFNDSYTVRLIPTAYIDQPAMTPLVDTQDELEFLEEIEALTSARLSPDIAMPDGIDPGELIRPESQPGWTYINAAFCHVRPEGNRFNDGDRGAWYGAWSEEDPGDAVLTSQAEVGWHLGRELAATGVFENLTSYREIWSGLMAEMHDLRDHPDEACLDPDIEQGHAAGQELSRQLLAIGSNGVLYPSARREGGLCLAIFRPYLVQKVRQGGTWIFEWQGHPDPEIRAA